MRLKKILVKPGYISEEDFEVARKDAELEGKSVEEKLVENGFISDEHLGKTIADGLDYYFVNLHNEKIPSDLLRLMPEVVARAQAGIFFKTADDALYFATTDPNNFEFISVLERKTRKKIIPYYTTAFNILSALKSYKSDLGTRVEALLRDLEQNPAHEENIIRLVDVFMEYAHDNLASDIHLEPLRNFVSVRFRIDGVLHEVVQYPLILHPKIVFRVKILSRLRTDEHASAQDGRFEFKKNSSLFDVRVSILPITKGENVVMRLLSEKTRRLALDDLGLLEPDISKVKKAVKNPYGMILAVGPTGSGKTTTLYALLQILSKLEVNIMTIEDPIEYDIERIQQTQVNPQKNITFSTGLRSIVRQDPDIIMVGEIRDNETADIAVNAAMTGHLLFTTMHANDAATTFPRLLEMGLEPFLVASSVNVVIAQRLVRRICDKCRISHLLNKEEIEVLEIEKEVMEVVQKISKKNDLSKIRFYKGKGCSSCDDLGYSGRIGIFEVLEVTDDIRPLIIKKAPASEINKKTRELGMNPMLYDGIYKVFQGITTLEEVIRGVKA